MAHNMWGLRAEEVEGQSLLGFDIGLPVEKVKSAIRAVLEGNAKMKELNLNATDRKGRPLVCKITCTPLTGHGNAVKGSHHAHGSPG